MLHRISMYGCLVVHGLTGTPVTVSCITNALETSGFRVIAPALAGHGSVEELHRSHWEQWYASVREAYTTLKRETDGVFYAGISLGALLGLKLAIDEGSAVRAMALMSTPLVLAPWNRVIVPLVRYSPLRLVIRSIRKNYDQSVADPEGRKFYREHSLPRIPQGAVFQLADLQREVRSHLSRLMNPLLLIHARKDPVAPYANVELLKRLVGSHVVEVAAFARSRHVIALDLEKNLAANAIVQFFRRFG